MKKALLTATALSFAAFLSTPANAECDGFYGALRAGVVKHDVSSSTSDIMSSSEGLDDNRLMLAGALGYRYKHFRGELEYIWRKHTNDETEYDVAKFKTYSYMLNAYWDFMPYHWWSPYVNAGVGLTQLRYSNIDTTYPGGISNTPVGNYKPMNFTWSVGAGLSLKVTNRLNVDAGYRYFDMGSIRHADVTAQEVYGGIRYVF